jgi:cytochrome c oxidase subunit 2
VQDAICQSPSSTIKVVRNQWNWQRETEDVDARDHLLDPDEVDNLASFETPAASVRKGVRRVVVTRTDVLHSLGLPRLGLKLDSVPGRLNVTTVEIMSPGLYVGSCYELCGRGHRAMPINLLRI